MALIKCPECGKEISNSAFTCPHCGYPINSSVNKTIPKTRRRLKKPVLITLIIFFVCIISIIMFLKFRIHDNGLYDDIEYRTPISELKDKYSLIATNNNIYMTSVKDFCGMKGVDALVYFECYNNDEYGGVVAMLDSDTMSGQNLEDYVIEEFTKKYGKPSDTSNGGEWLTSKSKIEVHYASYSGFVNVEFQENTSK